MLNRQLGKRASKHEPVRRREPNAAQRNADREMATFGHRMRPAD